MGSTQAWSPCGLTNQFGVNDQTATGRSRLPRGCQRALRCCAAWNTICRVCTTHCYHCSVALSCPEYPWESLCGSGSPCRHKGCSPWSPWAATQHMVFAGFRWHPNCKQICIQRVGFIQSETTCQDRSGCETAVFPSLCTSIVAKF